MLDSLEGASLEDDELGAALDTQGTEDTDKASGCITGLWWFSTGLLFSAQTESKIPQITSSGKHSF